MQQYIFCDRCGSTISLRDIKQIGIRVHSSGEVKVAVKYLCPRCKRTGEEFIETNVHLTMNVGLITEMLPHERERFSKMNPITSDELIEFYRYLRKLRTLPKRKLKEGQGSERAERTRRSTHRLT
ncbi:MAG: hypothetical protein RMK18_05415 [Armatimonadota bacterium]|nr:hypothetical protein [Armatimonadota bacterium]MCX7777954.1 hypothetical protein [Armatimonadota bacterium]MDW8025289.1 hypothetical protein [Armatimonadota bacterium]